MHGMMGVKGKERMNHIAGEDTDVDMDAVFVPGLTLLRLYCFTLSRLSFADVLTYKFIGIGWLSHPDFCSFLSRSPGASNFVCLHPS